MDNNHITIPRKFFYLLPILLGFIGGIIGFLILRNKDKKFAKRILIVGVGVTLFWFVIGFLTGLLMPARSGISIEYTTCVKGKINAVIKNLGSNSISVSEMKFFIDYSQVSPSVCSPTIPARSTGLCIFGNDLQGTHYLSILGPFESVVVEVTC